MLLKYFEKYKILSNFKLDMGAFNIQKYEKEAILRVFIQKGWACLIWIEYLHG